MFTTLFTAFKAGSEPSTSFSGTSATVETPTRPALPEDVAPQERVQTDFERATEPRKLREDPKVDDTVERRESVLNARIAAFEAAARRFAGSEFIQRDKLRREDEERAKKMNAAFDERDSALTKKLEALQTREQRLADVYAGFESREADLASKETALHEREEEFRREIGTQNYSLDQKVAFLKEQEKRLSGIADDLKSREAVVAQKVHETAEREERIARISIEAEVRENDFKRRDAAVQELQRRLHDESDQIAERNRQLQERVSELDARQSQLEFREASLKAREDELDFKESALSAREAKAAQYEVTLSACDKELARKSAAMDLREDEYARQTVAFQNQRDEISQRSAALNAREAELRRRHVESDAAAMRLLETQGQLDEKERLFEERSRKALDSIRRQKQLLSQMREELTRAI
jgi:uncharacterized protein (DUF3084 family)